MTAASAPAAAPTASGSRLRARGLVLGYDDRIIVDGADIDIPDGRITVLVGANASGKSTLLRGLSRLLSPKAGTVELDGRAVASIPRKELARTVGLLPQSPIAPEGITVSDLVGRGRHPHQGVFRRWNSDDDAIVARALADTDTLELADRPIEALSGGQRQRVWIAMALAQDPDILLLDEPTTFLDVAHQLDVLELVARLNAERGTTVVMVLHELSLAARYAHELVVLSQGRIIARGTPAEVLTAENVKSAFGLDAQIMPDPVTGSPLIVPEVGGGSRAHR